ncbi:hypothetical protein GCM10010331_58010 [Streptomyces xanthochromogenes]|nr:hypothetical protein GCM10010331_58010 [Streptomyces xanthochromogenes]
MTVLAQIMWRFVRNLLGYARYVKPGVTKLCMSLHMSDTGVVRVNGWLDTVPAVLKNEGLVGAPAGPEDPRAACPRRS